MPTSQQQSISISETGNELFVSVYRDTITAQGVINQVKRLKVAFPALHAGFYDAIQDAFKRNGFTDNRVKDAISHVIDTCPYPSPTIAQFISYDKQVRLYRHVEVCDMLDKGYTWDCFEKLEIEGQKPLWKLK